MESDSVSSNSSDDDNDADIIMILNYTTIIAAHSIESDSSDSTESKIKWNRPHKGKYFNVPRGFEVAYNISIHHYFSGDE